MIRFYMTRLLLGKMSSVDDVPERWRQLVADVLLPNEA